MLSRIKLFALLLSLASTLAAGDSYTLNANGHPLVLGGHRMSVGAFGVNPLGFAFTSVTGVSQYAHPTGILITGRDNRYDPAFAAARAAGAEVLTYLDPMERPDVAVGPLDLEFYDGDITLVPLWPYPAGSPGTRINYPGTKMTDMTAGSAWILHVVSYIEALMIEGKVDGVYLDVVGSRLYSTGATGANFDDWPADEQAAWTAGNVDLVQRLNASRLRLNPSFIIVNNNVWDNVGPSGLAGEQYVDGVAMEHHPFSQAFAKAYVGHTFRGVRRRVIVIAQSTADAVQWQYIKGVTHVSDQTSYLTVDTPSIPFCGVIP